ncbi:MAG: proline dehydrogenase family protein [Bacteroidetes bacterium]|nr:proline dehydrogenase family protein [Bacteroidota bacterium]
MYKSELFENTEVAFELKTDSEIERACFLFKLIANEPLVKIGTAVTNFAIKSHLPVEGLIRSTVFDHFCGGTSEQDCLPIVEKMYDKGVYSVLDFSVEGKETEAQFDAAFQRTISIIEFANTHASLPFAVFKPTGFARFDLLEKVSANTPLSDVEKVEWEKVVARFDQIAACAAKRHIGLLVDAEESWIQQAVDDLVLDLMRKYNKTQVVIFNTIQCYRHDRLDYVRNLLEIADHEGFRVGFKIVRGAYMEKENKRAAQLGIPSPICPNKNSTDDNFDTIMGFILKRLDHHALFVGTHNEESTLKGIQLMQKYNIDKKSGKVWFGQLFGMSDHISFNIAKEGFLVLKYVPFGPVRDVMPYLIRRAEENTSVAGQTSRELSLLLTERKRRKI